VEEAEAVEVAVEELAKMKVTDKKIIVSWLAILAVAIFWRFWNYENRWVLNQDQGRDATIGLYAIRNNLIPEIGSPSSAGPFNFGPWYLWLIMGWEKLLPTINGPWIGFTLLSVLSVVVYANIGKMMGGRRGLIIAGLLSAVAVGQVENAPDMLNTVIVGVSSILALWATVKLVKSEKWMWAIMVGFMVGLSINFHFQSWGLMTLPLAIFLINGFKIKKRLGWGLAMATGWVMAFLPLIIYDLNNSGVWIKSVIEYYTVGVKRFYVPVRWLTEIRDFWPQLFGAVTTGINWTGYGWIMLGIVLVIILVKRKIKIERFWWILLASLLAQVLLMRFYRGVRSREYLIVFQGYIILICSWIAAEWYKLNKLVGGLIMVIVIVLAGITNYQNILKYPSQARLILDIQKEIDEKVTGKKDLYHYQESNMVSMPLFYLWYRKEEIGDGTKIGFCDGNRYACPDGQMFKKDNYFGYLLVDTTGFAPLTAKIIYQMPMVNYGVRQ